MPANVDELVVRVADICTYKWDMIRNRPLAYLISGFAGGAVVVFGATLALAVSAGVPENLEPGLSNLLMGLVFMFSLVIIMVSGMTLVTADMYIGVIGIFHRRTSWGWFIWGVTLGYVGNFLDSMFFMWLISKSAAFSYMPWLMRAHAIGVAKLGQTAGHSPLGVRSIRLGPQPTLHGPRESDRGHPVHRDRISAGLPSQAGRRDLPEQEKPHAQAIRRCLSHGLRVFTVQSSHLASLFRILCHHVCDREAVSLQVSRLSIHAGKRRRDGGGTRRTIRCESFASRWTRTEGGASESRPNVGRIGGERR